IPVLTRESTVKQLAQAMSPPAAQTQGPTAKVRLLITIAIEGSVGEASVIEPVGNGFDEAALAAVWAFEFTPAEVDNVPAAIQIEYVYNFELQVPDAG